MAATFVVETGTGLSNANSFASVAVADQYNDDHSANAGWTALATSLKEKHLRLATQYIVANWNGQWRGCKYSVTQSLPWPRYGVEVDGFCLPSNTIPNELIQATCEAAMRSYAGDTLLPDYDAGASGTIVDNRVKIGPLEFETSYGSSSSPGKVYNIIYDLLRDLVYGGTELLRG